MVTQRPMSALSLTLMSPPQLTIDARLYLPSEWVKDKARCDAAKVPYRARKAKTKPELALEMARHTRQLGVRFSCVGMDSLYGNGPAFLRALANAKMAGHPVR